MRECSSFRLWSLLIAIVMVVHTCGVPAARWHGWAPKQRHYADHPMIGPLKPSQDIQEFVDSLILRDGGDANETGGLEMNWESTTTTPDSGERLKPKNMSIHANVGFEQYWAGGDWVFRKADVDRCNTSYATCSTIYKNFGPVCGGSHNLNAHHTFNTICDLMDMNCRDGTATSITKRDWMVDVKWYPVQRNGSIRLKISTTTPAYFAFTRGPDFNLDPKFAIMYGAWGYYDWPSKIALMRDGWYSDIMSSVDYSYWPDLLNPFLTSEVRNYIISWNETQGMISFYLIYPDGSYGKGLLYSDPKWRSFPIRYMGFMSGNITYPTWMEITGYMMAYRGKCRSDLPTLPTEMPENAMRQSVELYNFAERMDEFGYNFSRGPDSPEWFTDHYEMLNP